MIKQWTRSRRENALNARGFYSPDRHSEEPGIFIGGCDRSGTTLFKTVLDRHRRLACGPETSMFGTPFRTRMLAIMWEVPRQDLDALARQSSHLTEFTSTFYREYLLKPDNKARWIDKTPNNVRAIQKILDWYPNGKFIHLIRDGRDVVCSLRTHRKERIRGGKIVPKRTNNPIDECATVWRRDTERGIAYREHPNCFEVRYEAFLQDPEAVLRRVCRFIDEEYDPRMLDPTVETKCSKLIGSRLNNQNANRPIDPSSSGRWKRDLSPDERRAVRDIAGELLISLGYTDDHAWADAPQNPEI